MAKKISAGVITHKDGELLMGRVTGKKGKLDIPKGGIEEGESFLETAHRETFEEFGIEINPSELKDLGRFKYLPGKDLYLFLWEPDEFPNLSTLFCTSYFFINGKSLPEINGYEIVTIDEAKERVPKGLAKIFDKIFKG